MNVMVSIILPVYNSEDTISETIESLLNQSFQGKYEIIIINDGSTDSSLKIINNYQKKFSSIIKVIDKNNTGVSDSRNAGIKKAIGKYITFIDSDDLYDRDYLNILSNSLEKNISCDLAICGYKLVGDKHKNISVDKLKENVTKVNDKIIQKLQNDLLFNQLWNKIYKSDIIKNNSIEFNKNLSLGEDAIFNIEYLKYVNDIYIVDKCLYKYRITNNGLGFKYRKNGGQLKLFIFRKMYELYKKNNFDLKYVEKNILKQYISWIANIVNKKNKDNFLNKYKSIKNIWKNDYYKSDYSKISNYKIKFIFIMLKFTLFAYAIGMLANCYDSMKKKKIYD